MTAAQPQHQRRVLRAFLHYGLAGYTTQIVNFLLIPLYTKKIAPAEMGILEIALTAQGLLAIVMRLGIAGSVSRYYFDATTESEVRDLVTTVAAAISVATLVLVSLALLGGPPLFRLALPSVPFHPYMDIAVITAGLQAAPDIQRRLLQAREQSARASKLSLSFGITATVLNVALVLIFDLGAFGVLAANCASAALYACVAIWSHRDELRGRFQRSIARKVFGYGLPLVPYHVGAWAQQFASRWVLGGYDAVAALGQVGIATRMTSPIGVVRDALSNSVTPVYFSWRKSLPEKEALAEIRRLARSVTLGGSLLVLGAATIGGWFVRHAMAVGYRDAAPLVGALAAAQLAHLLYGIVGSEFFYSKRTAWISLIFIASSAASVVVVVVGYPLAGVSALAAGQVVGGVVEILIASWMATRTFPFPLGTRTVISGVAAGVIGCALPWLVPSASPAVEFACDAAALCAAFLVVGLINGGLGDVLQMTRRVLIERLARR